MAQSVPSNPRRMHGPPLRPIQALLSLPWLVALGLLALNDHVLKGSDLVSAALTGKLSDFAGLLVAPSLLAALCVVSRRRTLLACHVAVGVVFAAIQLSSTAAGAWAGMMGVLGFPWVITSDPTDLIALPALWASWRWLLPAMSRQRSRAMRRAGEATAGAVGLLCCMATSDDDGSGDSGYTDTSGEAHCDPDGDLPTPLEDPLPISVSGSTDGTNNSSAGSCGGSTSGERVYQWTAPAAGSYVIDTGGSEFDTVLYVRTPADDPPENACGDEIDCSDDDDTGEVTSALTLDLKPDQTVIIVVDGFAGEDGDYTLRIAEE